MYRDFVVSSPVMSGVVGGGDSRVDKNRWVETLVSNFCRDRSLWDFRNLLPNTLMGARDGRSSRHTR